MNKKAFLKEVHISAFKDELEKISSSRDNYSRELAAAGGVAGVASSIPYADKAHRAYIAEHNKIIYEKRLNSKAIKKQLFPKLLKSVGKYTGKRALIGATAGIGAGYLLNKKKEE